MVRLFNYPGWQPGEHRAWQEYADKTGLTFRHAGSTYDHEQVVVPITGVGSCTRCYDVPAVCVSRRCAARRATAPETAAPTPSTTSATVNTSRDASASPSAIPGSM